MYLKYLYLHIYLHYKFRFSTVTGKHLSVMSEHFSVFVDFMNIFIRYSSGHSTLKLSVMVTEMVSTTFFFSCKEIYLVELKSQ